MYFGTLEAGGTKMVLSVGNENNELLEQTSIPTEAPEKTIPAMIDWFRDKGIVSLGIGTFGPVDLKKDSSTYGWITKTPKPGWSDKPLLPPMQEALGVPALIDTDVNAAALAEWQLGAVCDGRHRHRSGPGDRRETCTRTGSSGTGTYAAAPGGNGSCPGRVLPISQGLPGRAGFRSCH